MKNTDYYKGSTASSFHGHQILTTPKKLMQLADKLNATFYSSNTGEDKTNFDFSFINKDGDFFTVYDWKEYRKLNIDSKVNFHIGAATSKISRESYYDLVTELNNI